MAFTTATTLSAAMTAGNNIMSVASVTGITGGMVGILDGEFVQVPSTPTTTSFVVIRGQMQTSAQAHPSSANVLFGLASDFASPPPAGGSAYVGPFPIVVASYSAAGAIALPAGKSTAFAVINGSAALAMTVAAPTADQDGACLVISGNGAAQHTVTFTGGLSLAGTSYDVLTFNATTKPITITVYAVNGAWQASVAPGITGTVTSLTGGIA